MIHTVGPIWLGGNNLEDELLAQCYENSLVLATIHRVKHIAFPSISTGAYGFPVGRASLIALKVMTSYLSTAVFPERAIVVCFSHRDYQIYSTSLRELTKA